LAPTFPCRLEALANGVAGGLVGHLSMGTMDISGISEANFRHFWANGPTERQPVFFCFEASICPLFLKEVSE